MTENIEERQFIDCGDGCELIWKVEDDVEKVYFEFDDGEIDLICETNNYDKAKKAYYNTKNYMS